MAVKLVDYIKTYDNAIDPDVCESIIRSFSLSNSVYLDREQRPSYSHINITQNKTDPNWKPHQKTLMNVMDTFAEKYITDCQCGPDFPQQYSYEEFRMKCYNNNGHDQFKDHVDVADYDSARRFLVAFIYLNTVKVGGHTAFPLLNHQIEPKCGRILMFPATWQYRHCGRPPVSSKKFIVGSYLHYL